MNRDKALNMIKEFVLFILVTACAFGWWMLTLLIISFVTLSLIPFTIEGIVIIAIVGTVAIDVYYIIKKVLKYKKAAEEELRKSMYN